MQNELFQPQALTQAPKRVLVSEVAPNFIYTEAETVINGIRLRLATDQRDGEWHVGVQIYSACEKTWSFLEKAPDRQAIINRLDRGACQDFYLKNLNTLYVERMETVKAH